MNLLVLIKDVPDMTKVKFDSDRGVVDRSSAESEINPFDLNALQTAVNIKNLYGGSITVLTMGPPKSENSLRDAFSRGADKCILMTDRKFGGSDTYATSKTLASGIKYIGDYDLIICGEKSVDGDTAQVGAEVAEFLDVPHAYYVEKINNVDKNEIEVITENICGGKQIRKMKLPALIGVTKNINTPKLPTVNRKLKSLEIEIEKISLNDICQYIDENDTGFKGSPTKVSRIVIPGTVKRISHIYRDDYDTFKEIINNEITIRA